MHPKEITTERDARREADLARSKRKALAFLLGAAALFGLTLALPPTVWVLAVRACAEAALVGGLADWFAVVALFHRIPTGVPYITEHTAILPANKDRVADNLALFVQEKFLDPESLVTLIRRNDPAARAAGWLADPTHQDWLARHVVNLLGEALRLVSEAHVRQALQDAARAALDRVDLSAAAGAVLKSLAGQGRHQALLEQMLGQLLKLAENPATRQLIAQHIVEWLKAEHPLKAKVLPREWLGENGARLVANAVGRVLDQVRSNPAHELRESFEMALASLVQRLESDPGFRSKGEEIKRYLLEDEAFGNYVNELWSAMRAWLLGRSEGREPVLQARLREACGWLGRRLADDAALREELNTYLEQAARAGAPEFGRFFTTHIRDTIHRWDARDLSRQIELNIGKDLQAIRINGTLVGGLVGGVLYLLSHLVPWLAAASGRFAGG